MNRGTEINIKDLIAIDENNNMIVINSEKNKGIKITRTINNFGLASFEDFLPNSEKITIHGDIKEFDIIHEGGKTLSQAMVKVLSDNVEKAKNIKQYWQEGVMRKW